ncbi:DsbA family protein [Nitrospinae bacterium AH_259_B05_G02_I21]|nr:DsbA family protein [Nitrospinae bacterium AH_259_B05_G02_I21]MDA2932322.1 DsbA family protein [Nitrospinae bacterium AH-259-F20]
MPQIERDYIETGKVKYVARDFPIERIHKDAFKAAEAANCAGEQGKYWEMHSRLFANRTALALKDLSGYAKALGLDMARFQQCLDSGKQAKEIRKDIADARKAGVRGTPTFFLGLTEPGKPTVKSLRVIRGARPYSSFKEAIDSLLSSKK